MQVNLQRRQVAFGLAATIVAAGQPSGGAAQERDAPYFRSGRFQFTLLEPRLPLPSVMLFPPAWQGDRPRLVARQTHSAQFLGDVVRGVPNGNANP